MTASETRSEKIHLRLTRESKQKLVVAAASQNRSVSELVLTSALERADEVLGIRAAERL